MSRLFASFGLAFVAALSISSCSQSTAPGAPDPSAATGAELRTGSAADESACLARVAEQTNNTVALISSEASDGFTEVLVAVGPEKARWSCNANDGQVSQIMSLVDEGAF